MESYLQAIQLNETSVDAAVTHKFINCPAMQSLIFILGTTKWCWQYFSARALLGKYNV